MFAPETAVSGVAPAGLQLCTCTARIVELAAHRGRERELKTIAADRGWSLPPLGQAVITSSQLSLSVRPGRWLLLTAPEAGDGGVATWEAACDGAGSAVEFSSGLVPLHLSGPAARDVLARSCRLDLHPQHFATGRAAATIMAQVATIIVALPRGLLILTPASTARHFGEWLEASARPFGLTPPSNVGLAALLGRDGT